MTKIVTLRNEIRQHFADSHPSEALKIALAAARSDHSPACWRVVHKELCRGEGDLRKIEESHSEIRIALAASVTVDNLIPYLYVELRLNGFVPRIYTCPYNQFQLEFRNSKSDLYNFAPDFTILLADMESLGINVPRIEDPVIADGKNTEIGNVIRGFLLAFRDHCKGRLLINNFITPYAPLLGLFDNYRTLGFFDFYRQANVTLAQVSLSMNDTFVVDVDRQVGRIGYESAINRRTKYLARMPFSELLAQQLAHQYVMHVRATSGKQRKCLVVDLDNVLWGGVVGEDGILGIHIGDDPPGNVYRDIQRAINFLYRRGTILAVASKNNPEDALAVFSDRNEMHLQRKHFAAIEIGWHDKATSLRRIAEKLNIGLDAMVFLDDSPHERLLIETQLPEVEVFPFPDDVCALPDLILNCGYFDGIDLTEEDVKRGEMYAQRSLRSEAGARSSDLHEFLTSLCIVVTVGKASVADIPRVAQLTQRTNQFNLTTRRYTTEDISHLIDKPSLSVLVCSVNDRFGDEGIVGVAIMQRNGDCCKIDSFLLSCRVLGRGVEQAFLATVLQCCMQKGAEIVRGEYIPTPKNSQVKDFYRQQGFRETRRHDKIVEWEIELNHELPEIPHWIKVQRRTNCIL